MSSPVLHPPASIGELVTVTAPLWRWTGNQSGTWHFITIAGEAAEHIAGHALMRRLELGKARGFGSVKVAARVEANRWNTSVFPNGDGTWILPVKAAIRKAEDLAEGDDVTVELALL